MQWAATRTSTLAAMTRESDDQLAESDLPAITRWTGRVAPCLLMALGAFMIVVGAFASRSDTVLITLIIAGLVMVVAGAVLPRAVGEWKVTKDGLTANLQSLAPKVDPKRDYLSFGPAVQLASVAASTTVATEATATATHPERGEAHPPTAAGSGQAHNPTILTVNGPAPTIRELIAAATAQGWAVSHTTGTGSAMLSRMVREPNPEMQMNAGDTYSIIVPTSDENLVVTQLLMDAMTAAGLSWPT